MGVRILLATAGNYAGVYALVALIAPRLPMQRTDAVLLTSCLAFPVMVGLALWVFAESRILVVAGMLAVPVLLLMIGSVL